MFGIREGIIVALVVACGLFGYMWRAEVVAHAKLEGEVEAANKAAEERAKEITDHYEGVVKDVSNSWYASLPGVQDAAVANYVRRFGGAARLCPGPSDGVLPAVRPGDDVPAAAQGAEVHAGGEQEQLAPDTAAFVKVCGEDARARNLTREWALRVGLEAEQ